MAGPVRLSRLLIAATVFVCGVSISPATSGQEPDAGAQQEPIPGQLQQQFYARTVELARQAWRRGEVSRARTLLKNTDPELRSWEYDYLSREFDASEILFELPWANTTMRIRDLNFSRDGSLLAACSDDLHVRVWDFERRQLLFNEHDETRTVEFDSAGNELLTGLSDTVTIRDSRSGTVIDRLHVPDSGVAGIPLFVQFSADDSTIAVQHTHRGISLLDSVSAREKFRFKDHQITTEFRFHPAEQKLAIATSLWNKEAEHRLQCGVELYDLSGQVPKLIRTISLHHLHSLRSLDFSPDGRRMSVCGTLFSNTRRGECAVVDLESGRFLFGLRDHRSNVVCVRFSADGKLMASGSYDGAIHLWNAEDGSYIDSFHGHTAAVKCVAFRPDGRTLASGSADGTVRLWSLQPNGPENRPRIQIQFERDLSLSDNGQYVYTRWHRYDPEAKTRFWEVKISLTATGQERRTLRSEPGTEIVQTAESHDSHVTALSLRQIRQGQSIPAVSPDLSQESPSGLLRLIDRTTGETTGEVPCESPAQAIAFSPDDRFLYTAGPPATPVQASYFRQPVPTEFVIARWEAATGNPLFRQTVNVGDSLGLSFRRLAVSPDGSLLAAAVIVSPKINQWKSAIYLFDPETGRQIGELSEPETMNVDFQFSPDGRRLAVAAQKSYSQEFRGYVSVWNLERREKTLTIPAYQTSIHSVTFTPDGRRVVSAGAWNDYEGGEITFWDSETGERVFQREFATPVLRLAFGPKQRTLIAVEKNGTISILKAD